MKNGQDYNLPSGAKLYVSVAEWGKVKALHDAVARAALGSGVSGPEIVALLKTVRFKTVPERAAAETEKPSAEEQIAVLAALTRKFLELGASKELEQAIFTCAEAAVYKPQGLLADAVQFKADALGYGVFDHAKCRDEARGDYYAICMAVVEENLRPFGLALYSLFRAHVEKSADTPESSTAKV